MLRPVGNDQIASVFGGAVYRPGGAGTEQIAGAIGNLNLAVGSQQSALLFRFAIQHHRVVGGGLVQGDGDAGAVFLQVLINFHALIVSVHVALGVTGSEPAVSASAGIGGDVLCALAGDVNPRLILSGRGDGQGEQEYRETQRFHGFILYRKRSGWPGSCQITFVWVGGWYLRWKRCVSFS